ncbi:Nucleolar protein 12 [Penicillium longicatenatum]|nr:Nucleolar protein 12 [Penicillium longicatenatum]
MGYPKTVGGAYPKKRKLTPKVEEVNFDSDARQEWLTGFHKRKVQRAKHAQEVAIQKMKEEKRHDRAKLREERAADMKRIMEEHKNHLKRLKEEFDSDDSDDSAEESDEEWGGIEEPPAVDYEAEYVDEDKYTTVTVEEMDTSRDALRKSAKGEDSEEEEEKPSTKTPEPEATPDKKVRKTTHKPKPKKKQFRYESKGDRKIAASKQRSSKAKKAKARREQ